jgi:uncharacterized membrane protein YfcA
MLLANVGGIGGGGIAIPMCMYFFSFDMKASIAISSFSIMSATVGRYIFNFNDRHPEKPTTTCIDYNMATVMMPLTLIGSMVGSYIYHTFPDLVLMIILTLLLFVLWAESTRKFISMRRKETELYAREEEEQKK